MMILAIVNQKGGVGKTTTAVTFAHDLAIRGQRVLIVDLDSQGQIATSLGMNKAPGIHWLIVDNAGQDAIANTNRPGLHAILSDKTTVSIHSYILNEPLSEYVLKRALENIAPSYNVIVLDTAPSADVLQVNALCACTHFLIPTKLDHLSVQGAGATLATAASLKRLEALKGQFIGVLPTMWEQTTTHTKEILKELAQQFGNLLWSPIPDDTKAREATLEGKTLFEYAPLCRALSGASTSNGLVGGYARAVERLMEELKL